MHVYGCHQLRYLLSLSMARSLVHLKELRITACERLEEIVTISDQAPSGETTNILFGNLVTLELIQLSNLLRFCTESSLEQEGESEGAGQACLFSTQVKFPRLESLLISELDKLQILWNNELYDQTTFCRLKIFYVGSCAGLVSIFVPLMMSRLDALETLAIQDCNSVEVIFEVGVPHVLRPLHRLGSVLVHNCRSLKSIIPASVAIGLHKLQSLSVSLCGEVEEIIFGDPETELVFPEVTSIRFFNMPNLCRLDPGLRASRWPLLEKLNVSKCDKVKLLAAEILVSPENHVISPRTKDALFLIYKDSFPNLELLALDASEIFYGASSPAHIFRKLEHVVYQFWSPFSQQDTTEFLQKLHKLVTLEVCDNDCTEIFVNEAINGEEIQAVQTLSGVKSLSFNDMPVLLQLGNGTVDPIFTNLESLVLLSCESLRSLYSSAISFHNLTVLTVSGCGSLVCMMSYSMAKSLVQLTRLDVSDCVALQVIIEANDEGKGDVVFSRLQYCELSLLPRLQGFCSANCIVRLPSSTVLEVGRECPIQLKISPNGVLVCDPKAEE